LSGLITDERTARRLVGDSASAVTTMRLRSSKKRTLIAESQPEKQLARRKAGKRPAAVE